MRRVWVLVVVVLLSLATGAPIPAPAQDADPEPGTLTWWMREFDNLYFANGRLREQNQTAGFRGAVNTEVSRLRGFWNEEDREAFGGRPRMTLTRWVGYPFIGDPWRNEVEWGGAHERVYFLNRWGAKLTVDLWGPADLFDSAERRLTVVITTGSIQGNSRMYWWAAQTLADAGYVVVSYDVQGQGESETFGHRPDGRIWCDGADQPPDTPVFLAEATNCPGVIFQQSANFGVGAIDAHNFALSTPAEPYEHYQDGTGTAAHNPWHAWVDPERMGAAGHSLGAAAVSFVQGHPEMLREPIRAVVTWDTLAACSDRRAIGRETACEEGNVNEPLAPALNLTNDYFLSFIPMTAPPDAEESLEAFDHWRAAGEDVMSIALRGGTHLEYTSVPYLLTATKHGQDVATHYTLAWFDRYLRDDPTATDRLLAREITFEHRDPLGVPDAESTTWAVEDFASFYYDSGVSLAGVCYRDWKHQTEPC